MAVSLWFVAAGAVLLVELHSGTVYLLAIAFAAGLAGAMALLGAEPAVQLAVAAIGGTAGCYIAHGVRKRQAKLNRPTITAEVGQSVVVVKPGATPRVSWRGSEWDAVLADGSAATAEDRLKIQRQEGNRLVLTRG
jgi:membrane protein implicated in regulation of membrane protease activity